MRVFKRFTMKKKLFEIGKRNYMSSKHIQQFKYHKDSSKYNESNGGTYKKEGYRENLNSSKKIRKCNNSKFAPPFEIYKWNIICNSFNIHLLKDLIKEKKVEQFRFFDFYKIMNPYHVIVNVDENDMFVDPTVHEYFSKCFNYIDFKFRNYKVIQDFISFLKENKSFLYLLLYKKGTFLQALPFKFFWHYENTEDEYAIRYEESILYKEDEEGKERKEDANNEYIFQNIVFDKTDFNLKEHELDNFSKNETTNIKEEPPNKGKNIGTYFDWQKRTFSYLIESKLKQLLPWGKRGVAIKTNSDFISKKEETTETVEKNDSTKGKSFDEKKKKTIENPAYLQEETETQFLEKTPIVEENNFLYNIKLLDKKEKNEKKKTLRINKLPASPLSRATTLGKIVFDVARNSSFEYVKNMLLRNNKENNVLTEKNAEIIAKGLSKMRGVILKLGQMISLQEEHISPILGKALKIAHNSADAMPPRQLKQVLRQELGDDFEKKFDSFDYEPFASASIGQVHEGYVNGERVAIKIQYPGILDSIDSDIKNVLFINQYTNLILKNLYIENICKEIKKELKSECDYINEAKYYIFFKNVFKNSRYFYVPSVYNEYVTKRILVTSYVEGVSIEEVAKNFPQHARDSIGQRILYLCLHELFVFKIMNTDPNLGNFIYDHRNDKLCLIDFGATRSYKSEFVDEYLRLVKASTEDDEKKIYHYSYMLNFFNGKENDEMKNSHIRSVILVGKPFKTKVYDFGQGDLAKQVYNLLPKIIHNRLVPPRPEIYTLHRKLSGSYLICMKLKAKIQAADIFQTIYKNYIFSTKDTYNEKEVNKI